MDWSYVAGFFDGEGSIRVRHDCVEMVFANTCLEALKAIQSFMKAGVINERSSKRIGNMVTKALYILRIGPHKDVLRVCENILDKSIVKHEEIARTIEHIKNKKWQPRSIITITKDELNDLYWKQQLSANEIAERLGIHHGTILQRMQRFGIPRRTKTEANRLRLSKQNRKRDSKGRFLTNEQQHEERIQ